MYRENFWNMGPTVGQLDEPRLMLLTSADALKAGACEIIRLNERSFFCLASRTFHNESGLIRLPFCSSLSLLLLGFKDMPPALPVHFLEDHKGRTKLFLLDNPLTAVSKTPISLTRNHHVSTQVAALAPPLAVWRPGSCLLRTYCARRRDSRSCRQPPTQCRPHQRQPSRVLRTTPQLDLLISWTKEL